MCNLNGFLYFWFLKRHIFATGIKSLGSYTLFSCICFFFLQVNGINLRRVTHDKAVLFLKHNQVVNLLIARKKEQPSWERISESSARRPMVIGWSKGTADNTSTQRNAVIRELGTLRSSIKLKESKHLSRFKSRRTFYSWHCLALTSHWFVTQHLFVTQQGDLGTLSLTWNCKCTIDPFSRKLGFESESGAELQISVLINRRTSGKTVC